MQLRLFGSTGPTPAFKRDFQLLARLSDPELESLSKWFANAQNSVSPGDAELSALSVDFSVNPEELGRVIALLRFVLNSWRELEISVEDISKDLTTLGYDSSTVQKIARLLVSLEGSRDRVHRAVLRRAYETSGLPTIDDVNLVWDIRPVFGDFTYSPESRPGAVLELLDYVYVLILEFEASRADGKSETSSLQLSEEEFTKLADALARAKQQLDVLKLNRQVTGA